MSPRDWRFRLEDIRDSLALITEYIQDMDYETWKIDRKTVDAVTRNIEIIGEAASHVPEEIQARYHDIPWYEMKGMRNILIHEYFGVDLDVLWQTVHQDLPPLKSKIEKLIQSS